jgi:hypothetical protein
MKRKSLDILRHVYGEEAGEPLDGMIEQDDALHDEYVALREIKSLMDARPRHQPNPETVDAILQEAHARSVSKKDRTPVIPITRLRPVIRMAQWTRPLGYAIAACFLLVAGYWIGFRSASTQPADVALAPGEALLEMRQEEPPVSLFGFDAENDRLSAADEAVTGRSKSLENYLKWEDTDDLFLIQWRIGSLEENLVGASWDKAVPLGGYESFETSAELSDVVGDTAVRRIDR